jgi:hypothetical protein
MSYSEGEVSRAPADRGGERMDGVAAARATTTPGVPGPLTGAGLPFLAVATACIWLVRRRRKSQ